MCRSIGGLAFVERLARRAHRFGRPPVEPPGHRHGAARLRVLADAAARHGVEPELVRAIIRAESAFNRVAVSPKGARGLMQLMPDTARRRGCRNAYDARANIEAGVEHLRVLLDKHHKNLPRVLAAYNAGSQSVGRYHGIPPYAETEEYVARVLRYRREYLRAERLGNAKSQTAKVAAVP
jgi:soluble lytic murein transglycosylase-like protein